MFDQYEHPVIQFIFYKKIKLLEIIKHSQFRIAVCISMVILLLGIVIVFTVRTMDEINQDFTIREEFHKKLTKFEDIKSKYEKQMRVFEQLKLEKDLNTQQDFWVGNIEIKNTVQDFNKFIIKNINDDIFTDDEYLEIQKKIQEYYGIHLMYENNVSELLKILYTDKDPDIIQEKYNVVKESHIELLEKNEEITKLVQIFPEYLIESADLRMKDFQTLQLIMIILIGIITTILVFFLDRLNLNLKLEIKDQTKNLQRLNSELRMQDSKRKEFISIASHELKGPIQPIFGFIDLANAGIIPKQEALDGITSVAFNLENIANNVLDLTKIENDELELHLERNNINEIILDVVNSENFNPERKVPIKTNLDCDLFLNMDKTRIGQVFRNIISNCIKFTQEGEIKIQTYLLKDEKKIKITITNTGPKIPENILPRIFKKFVTDKADNVSGTGLGLYISKKIIDAHKGGISAYNDKEHPVFEILLPIGLINLNEEKISETNTNLVI